MGFVVKVNGEKVWEDENEMHESVTRVSLLTPKGEAGALGVANDVSEVNVVVESRSSIEGRFLDLEEAKRVNVERERVEKDSLDMVKKGRKDMEKAEAAEAEVTAEATPAVGELVEEPVKATAATKKAT